jgi:hypothetical protein
MEEIKTKQTNANVEQFINSFVSSEHKRKDALELIKIIQEHTGYEAKMWGASIIGFGKYHYKSEKSSQEGDWPLVGFSPRKTAISLYIYVDTANQNELLQQLGTFKKSVSCIYIKKLSDINLEILKKMIDGTINFLNDKYEKQ